MLPDADCHHIFTDLNVLCRAAVNKLLASGVMKRDKSEFTLQLKTDSSTPLISKVSACSLGFKTVLKIRYIIIGYFICQKTKIERYTSFETF